MIVNARRMSTMFVLTSVLWPAAACDPPGEPDASSPSPAAAGTEREATPPGTRAEAPAKPRVVMPAAAALEVELVAIREGADTIEIEVALDQRVPPTDNSRPELRVGDESVRRSMHPRGQLDRLVFLVPRAQYERMTTGAPLEVRVLGRSSAAMPSPPTLDRSKVVAK